MFVVHRLNSIHSMIGQVRRKFWACLLLSAIMSVASAQETTNEPVLPAAEATTQPVTTTPVPDVASEPETTPATDEAAPTAESAVPASETADAATATDPAADSEYKSLDQDVQSVKKEVLDLNRELFTLEEELLFPANTQVAVFISMDVGTFFAIDTLKLKMDNKEVSNYLYTEREAQALLKGGVQRVYIGNLKVGKHELVAFFTGQGPNQRDYKRGATLNFEKGVGAKYLELKISDKQVKEQPEFVIKEWE
jgi:hypothetical protein